MPRWSTRSVITYMLVAGLIAATFLHVPSEFRGTLDNATMLCLGFFFKGVVDATVGK